MNIAHRLQAVCRQYAYALPAFLIALALYCVVFAVCGFAPFGEKTVLTWDLNGQYVSYLAWLRRALRGEESLWYTQSIALGSGTVGLLAYYLLSPFNLLLVLFDVERLPEGIALILLLKHACSACTMDLFLTARCRTRGEAQCAQEGDGDRRDERVHAGEGAPRVQEGDSTFFRDDRPLNLLLLVFSLTWSLCGYAVSMQFNLMWLDGLILLPLVCMGLERLIRSGRKGLLIASLWLSLVSNFYIGYMIWLFSLLYFLFLGAETGQIRRARCWGAYAASLVCAAGLGMVLILPLLHALSASKLSGTSIADKIASHLGGKALICLLAAVILCAAALWLIRRYQKALRRLLCAAAGKLGELQTAHPVPVLIAAGICLLLCAGIFLKIVNWGSYMGYLAKEVLYLPLKLVMGAFSQSEIVSGLPNIYVSSLTVLSVAAFCVSKRIPAAHKARHLALAGVLFLSMLVNPLNAVWHGFVSPAGSPYRYSFLFSFVLILMAAEAAVSFRMPAVREYSGVGNCPGRSEDSLLCREDVRTAQAETACSADSESQAAFFAADAHSGSRERISPGSVLFAAALLLWTAFSLYKYDSLSGEFLSAEKLALTGAAYLLSAVLLFPIIPGKIPGRRAYSGAGEQSVRPEGNRWARIYVLGALACLELLCNAVLTLGAMDYESREEYVSSVRSLTEIAAVLQEEGGYRIDSPNATVNGALLADYESLSHYSSVIPASTVVLLNEFGLKPDAMGDMETKITASLSAEQAGLLNIRYLFAAEEVEDEGYSLLSQMDGYYLYENSLFCERGLLVSSDGITDDPADYAALPGQDLQGVPQEAGSGAEEMIFTVEQDEASILLLSVAFDSGWSATIDGEPAEVTAAFDSLLCVEVPAGTHTVVFTYRTPYMAEGLLISLLTLAAMIGYLVLCRKRHPSGTKDSEFIFCEEST